MLPSLVTAWKELQERGRQPCAELSTAVVAVVGLLHQPPSPFPRPAKPPPPHRINILGDKQPPQPICFFVHICSQFGNVIYKYCFCSQGLTLMYVSPDGWIQCWAQMLGADPAWEGGARARGDQRLPQVKAAAAREGSSGGSEMMPRDSLSSGGGEAGTPALRTYGSMTKDSNPEKQTSPLHPSVLAWEFEAEPEPAIHFSNLSTSLCLYYHYPLPSKTHNIFPTHLPHPLLCFRSEAPLPRMETQQGQGPCLSCSLL